MFAIEQTGEKSPSKLSRVSYLRILAHRPAALQTAGLFARIDIIAASIPESSVKNSEAIDLESRNGILP